MGPESGAGAPDGEDLNSGEPGRRGEPDTDADPDGDVAEPECGDAAQPDGDAEPDGDTAAQPDEDAEPDGDSRGGRTSLVYPLKNLGRARQVVLVMPRTWTGTLARLEAYELGPSGWSRVLGPVQARVGRTGMIPGDRRVSGSATTPAGTFPLRLAFGLEPDPGTRLPYVHVTSDDHWWVADPASPHYNELRPGASGGFLTREAGRRGSERIAAHPQEYAYAVVIDFNRPFPDRRRGACISVRGATGLSTDGSVAVERDVLIELLRWLDPEKDPVITMAPERVVSQY